LSGWRREPLADETALKRLAGEVRAALPDLDMNHDIEWIAAAHGFPQNELIVLTDRDGDKIVGVATFLVSRAPLVFGLGGFTLLKRQVRQLKLYQGITTARADAGRAIGACFASLSDVMGTGVVFIGAVEIGSALHGQLVDARSELRRRFRTLAWGNESQHCLVRWAGGIEAYLASIGKKSGKELQRNTKLLMSDKSLACELRHFRAPEEVDAFLADGIAISDKTYQKKDLGLGISRGGAVERLMRFAAARGAFLGYILYIDGAPAAFRYGFVCGRTATMKQTGYDPKWAERQIGSVLFFQVLNDFAAAKLPVDRLDFMPDVNLFKLRTTNDWRQIRHYYLFKRDAGGTAQYLALAATDFLSRTLGALARRVRPRAPSEVEKYVARARAEAAKS
jgi:hypothetical protein